MAGATGQLPRRRVLGGLGFFFFNIVYVFYSASVMPNAQTCTQPSANPSITLSRRDTFRCTEPVVPGKNGFAFIYKSGRVNACFGQRTRRSCYSRNGTTLSQPSDNNPLFCQRGRIKSLITCCTPDDVNTLFCQRNPIKSFATAADKVPSQNHPEECLRTWTALKSL